MEKFVEEEIKINKNNLKSNIFKKKKKKKKIISVCNLRENQ